ncbi:MULTISPECIES: BolA family transcriptional regulator [Roseobacteraceae]|uniref:BolA family protein n=1 Tax=Roseobacteraceae TaxID=2854170 RepID=UPI00080A9F44|nr:MULTISPECIES: BolA family protein [Roseobacteraceae]ANT61153.1 BolA family transcriptional regulator [Salipiger sp. CCB-MM3]MCA0994387.1 BolA family transcriptional regulator [Alloyangia pacifica]NDW01028.1 BolA family transcriptional regulator [Salipiger sp. PrR002]NDW58569.1 BolA family transcriptional regulator [Salipiger sp. PrR004]
MSRAKLIESRLQDAFDPAELEVLDESQKHVGHSGYQEGGESHFHVRMRAAELGGMTRIQRHRAVHAALGEDLVAAIHALSLDLQG